MENKNYCTPEGNCTCENTNDERACRHFTAAWSNGLCLYRAWFEDRCLSPMALQAARGQAGNTEAA